MTTTRLSGHVEPQARQLATAMGAALVACPVAGSLSAGLPDGWRWRRSGARVVEERRWAEMLAALRYGCEAKGGGL